MAGMRDIKRKIKSVKNTQKITKAMKMVSAAKMRKAQEAMIATKPYALNIRNVVNNIGARVSEEVHPFLQKKETVNSIGLVVVTSDRGLCGGFNSNLIKKVIAFIKENSSKTIKFYFVGRKAYDFFKKRDYEILQKYTSFGGRVRYDDAIEMGKVIGDDFVNGVVDEVYTIYNEFKSVAYQVPKVEKILPLSLEQTDSENVIDYLYEPSPESLIREILPRYLNFSLFSAILESIAGEHGARMAAMDNATRNAGELIKKLEITYNKARQAAITKEILDIVNGAEALK
ncbi:ATP synthase F1 subunit gamma [Deferribacteraceae bacterium V6Fe1]|nr:ATP synthase F1 subunit gamma [Deferribacteraceae bacterium V6Fe1]